MNPRLMLLVTLATVALLSLPVSSKIESLAATNEAAPAKPGKEPRAIHPHLPGPQNQPVPDRETKPPQPVPRPEPEPQPQPLPRLQVLLLNFTGKLIVTTPDGKTIVIDRRDFPVSQVTPGQMPKPDTPKDAPAGPRIPDIPPGSKIEVVEGTAFFAVGPTNIEASAGSDLTVTMDGTLQTAPTSTPILITHLDQVVVRHPDDKVKPVEPIILPPGSEVKLPRWEDMPGPKPIIVVPGPPGPRPPRLPPAPPEPPSPGPGPPPQEPEELPPPKEPPVCITGPCGGDWGPPPPPLPNPGQEIEVISPSSP